MAYRLMVTMNGKKMRDEVVSSEKGYNELTATLRSADKLGLAAKVEVETGLSEDMVTQPKRPEA